jgi:hypothetical protein
MTLQTLELKKNGQSRKEPGHSDLKSTRTPEKKGKGKHILLTLQQKVDMLDKMESHGLRGRVPSHDSRPSKPCYSEGE